MSSSDIAIQVANLSKRYEIYGTPRDRLKQFTLPRLRRLAKAAQAVFPRISGQLGKSPSR